MRLLVKALVLCCGSLTLSGVSAVYIENNAYRGVTIAFSPSIQGNEVNSTKLKNVIQKASELLYLATRRRAFLSNITFLYPSTWTSACEQITSVTPRHPQGISVYVAGSKNKESENLLRAQHSKGCGAIGEVIYMSPAWLEGDEEELSREFVQQWAIYRYGVFEETAEPEEGLPCYTNDGKHWVQNGCYSTDISVDLLLDSNGLPSCEPMDIANYHNLTSSLMSSVSSSKITDFCDGSTMRPHNPVAPTRHNRICRGKPVWSVIKESEDFRYVRNPPREPGFIPPKVSFSCFRESTNYIIFAVQTASKEDVEEIVDDVRLSLLRFLLFEVWPKTQVSVVTFHSMAENTFHLDLTQPAKVSEEMDNKVTARRTVPDVCLSCGLESAFTLSRKNEGKSTAIFFMVFASDLKRHNLGDLIDLLEFSPSRTYLIIIQDKEADFTAPNLIRATRKTGGEIFMVPRTAAILMTKMSIFLNSVLKNPLSIQDNVAIIHQSSFFDINEKAFQDTVKADVCLEGKMTYTLTCDMNRLAAVSTSTGTNCFTLPNMKDTGTKIRCSYIATLINETSLRNWTFSFHDKGGVTPLTCSSIATVQLKENSTDLLTVKGWTNVDTIEPDEPGRNVLIIYAEIMHNSVPVTNARVQASVYSSISSTPTTIELLDTGNGDPDMKKGDGIYSRYFTRTYNKGMHSVVIYAKGDITNCGHTDVNQEQMEFSRIVPGGSFVVTEQPEHMDYYPPSRIGDLRVINIDHNDFVVTLQWTAPGDNYDEGTANRYNLKFSQTMSDLKEPIFETGNMEILGNISQASPKLPSGTLQVATVILPPPTENRPYYLAIQAVNKNDDASLLSNIVQIVFTENASFRTKTTTTTVPDTSQELGERNSSESINSTAEGTIQTTENWGDNTTVFTPNVVDNTTGISTDTITITTMDPLSNKTEKLCDEEYITILASFIGGGIIILILIINAIFCTICFRKHRAPKKLSRKASLRPPHNMTVVPREGPYASNNYAFSGPNGDFPENLQDFELDFDYTFVPGSQRVKSRNLNYTTATPMQAENGFTNRSLTRRFNIPPESEGSMPNTLPTAGVQFTRRYREDDSEANAVSLGLV